MKGEAASSLKEQEFKFKQMELKAQTKQEIRLRELELNQVPPPQHGSGAQADFDVNKCIRMIPPFNG